MIFSDPNNLKCLKNMALAQYYAILADEVDQKILDNFEIFDITEESDFHVKLFCAAIASLSLFAQNNFTGPIEKSEHLSSLQKKAIAALYKNDDYNENVRNPELLYFAKTVFSSEKLRSFFPTCYLWFLRANYLHQQILDEPSGEIFAASETIIDEFSASPCLENQKLKAIFHLQAAHFYLLYKRCQSSEKHLKICESALSMNVELKSALGKRTKYQAYEKPQFFVGVALEKSVLPSKDCSDLPQDLLLEDDVRLERVKFTEENEQVELGALEESVVLTR